MLSPPVSRDPARACLALLVLVDLALIAWLPVIVGQDLPQHLSYARILADYADPRLAFAANFTLPAHPQPYFTAYFILAGLTRLTSVLTACRIVYASYVIAMAASFAALVRAIHSPGATRTPWTALFGALLPWNPVQLVGFLPFMLSLPAVTAGAAALVRAARSRSALGWVALAAAAATSLHLVAGATLVVFALVYALFCRTRNALLGAAVALASLCVTLTLWHTLGERGLAELPTDMVLDTIRREGLFRGLVLALGVQWNGVNVKETFVVATLLGPLARSGKIAVGAAMGVLCLVALVARRPARGATSASRSPFGLAALAFALLVALGCPASVRLPDDICLLDFRLYVVAFILAVAWIDPRWLAPRVVRAATVLFGLFVLAVWGYELHGAADEAMAVVRLETRLSPSDRLLALPFHNRSEFLDEDNAVTHYFPVYFTALRGGVTSSFWGKFSHHLPVGYRPGCEPPRPPDWDPGRFSDADLAAASHVLVEWPDADDDERRLIAAGRLRATLADGFTVLGCDGRWCLFVSRLFLSAKREKLVDGSARPRGLVGG